MFYEINVKIEFFFDIFDGPDMPVMTGGKVIYFINNQMANTMDPQCMLRVPIPIIEEIISFSSLGEKLKFRISCKKFKHITSKYFPTFTTTLCGNTKGYEDGNFLNAKFNKPSFGVLDSSSNVLFVSDTYNHIIRKIDLSTKKVSTLCGTPGKIEWKDGIGMESQFYFPSGLALNEREKILFVSDCMNHVIRSVNLVNGKVDTLVGNPEIAGKGDGIGKESTFNWPCGLTFNSILNHLYVVDGNNHSIRRVILDERRVETLCGNGNRGCADGSFEESMFCFPCDITFNPLTEELYVSDDDNHVIRAISLKDKRVRTLCGTPKDRRWEGGIHNQAKFNHPLGLGLDTREKCLYVCDRLNSTIRKISLSGEVVVNTVCGIEGKCGNRDGIFSTFSGPHGIVVDPHSPILYLMDHDNHNVRKIIDNSRTPSKERIAM